ncbi:UNVERIFIED_CONTAM: hypothetical protein FKN15_007773 [Acipenser sinensis]
MNNASVTVYRVEAFLLDGVPGLEEYQSALLAVFLLVYLVTFAGNLLIVILVIRDRSLHTPMYFFLCNLSFVDIIIPTAIIPKLLAVLIANDKYISFAGCFVQMYTVLAFGSTEWFILVVMSYDRYVAIVKPLHYHVIIKPEAQKSYERMNNASVTVYRVEAFLLDGVPGLEEYQSTLFAVFLLVYLVTFAGNLLIVILVIRDRSLHTPMYFFLCNLSFVDIIIPTAIIPKLLAVLVANDKYISFAGCFVQMYTVLAFGSAEWFLLIVMSYDRYVAIVKPLHYHVIIKPGACVLTAVRGTPAAEMLLVATLAAEMLTVVQDTPAASMLVVVLGYPAVAMLAAALLTAAQGTTVVAAVLGTPLLEGQLSTKCPHSPQMRHQHELSLFGSWAGHTSLARHRDRQLVPFFCLWAARSSLQRGRLMPTATMNQTEETYSGDSYWYHEDILNVTVSNSTSVFQSPLSPLVDKAISCITIIILFITMVSLGCTMEISKIKAHILKPKGVAIAVVAQYGIMPLTAFTLAKVFQLGSIESVTVLICGCCPGGNLSNIFALALKGDMNLR